MADFKTEQEQFWASDFGDSYSARNKSSTLLAANFALFSKVLGCCPGAPIETALELGANIGMNLRALNQLLPNATLDAVEINQMAAGELEALGFGSRF